MLIPVSSRLCRGPCLPFNYRESLVEMRKRRLSPRARRALLLETWMALTNKSNHTANQWIESTFPNKAEQSRLQSENSKTKVQTQVTKDTRLLRKLRMEDFFVTLANSFQSAWLSDDPNTKTAGPRSREPRSKGPTVSAAFKTSLGGTQNPKGVARNNGEGSRCKR